MTTPSNPLLARRAEASVSAAMADTRVILVNGARQAGKSTLAGLIAGRSSVEVRNLDRPQDLEAAQTDPSGFVDFDQLMVIDEIQRAPELFLAIKATVDADPRPGRFLLTGSSQVLALRGLPDTLPGRSETIELWPLSQGEIDGTPDAFVDAAFALGPDLHHHSAITRSGYAERAVRGGFPEAARRTDPRRRARFFESYLTDLINRDIRQLGEIERLAQLRAMLRLIAGRNAGLLVPSSLGNDVGLTYHTVQRYLGLLEEIFLIKRIPAWSRNINARAVDNPKVAFVDTGIVANLLQADPQSLLRPGGEFGPLLEGFVTMELARQLTWSETRAELYHYRTKDKVEVDVVLENARGQVIAVEVKASTTVTAKDFRGLRHLEDRLGEDFLAGYVLHTGPETLPFGPKLRAVPISALWQVS
ncbi:ATP-binding protein [Amycolatopsis sp. NBC_01480]|uniref:ATP-binding protein n=1 Tax=Amycolatopsis sp. NBC_01480 TaxID=2903562 RepID=UPI002E2C3A20|nr:ATP-binding protein [Amycolatopsis sp. NBC_01480]